MMAEIAQGSQVIAEPSIVSLTRPHTAKYKGLAIVSRERQSLKTFNTSTPIHYNMYTVSLAACSARAFRI
jgi:hypothetical protein